jgi:alpha-glucuronidase
MDTGKNYSAAWLKYQLLEQDYREKYADLFSDIYLEINDQKIKKPIIEELKLAIGNLFNKKVNFVSEPESAKLCIVDFKNNIIKNDNKIKKLNNDQKKDAFLLVNKDNRLILAAKNSNSKLYGLFKIFELLKLKKDLKNIHLFKQAANNIRMLNHWDNLDGSIERGYAGKSIFYKDNKLRKKLTRIKDYARLLASVGINSISINNVNVFEEETKLISEKFDLVKKIYHIFSAYGIKIFLSINYASPMEISNIKTADPLADQVINWWQNKVKKIYEEIPDFGGFLVKADSEGRPGPFTYGRNHAEGANMLAEALEPYGGILIWRCFVYNCQQDWRDYKTDRAKATYDNFKYLDGEFNDNVILQIKNGPMDFQVREPVTPLFGAMPKTNQLLELQITQEYTGQQKDLCYLVPQWKEILDFDTYAKGKESQVKKIISGDMFSQTNTGFAAVVNVGDDYNWTGHDLAQANLYGYGRLAWEPSLTAEIITKEWIGLTYTDDPEVLSTISEMLLSSWSIYENYTAPLGIGWMVNPDHHYGVNVDGYEYSRWGTYHRANHFGIGVDRSVKTGTGYTGQYFEENAEMYESMASCPDELLLFFHHVPYTYMLSSGKTLIQHIYDSHFAGVEGVERLQILWKGLADKIDAKVYNNVKNRLKLQLENSIEWRDRVNTYFYRISSIADEYNRKIYK